MDFSDLKIWLLGAAGVAVGLWVGLSPIIQILLALMVLDLVTGVTAAFIAKEVDSRVSWAGLAKKSLVLMLVGTGSLLQPYAQGVPLGEIVAGFYAANEALSILENVSRAGVPVPQVLVDALTRLNKTEKAKVEKL